MYIKAMLVSLVRIIVCISLLTAIFSKNLNALDFTATGHISVETGIWKPSSIDKEPTKPFKNVNGAEITKGLYINSPSISNFSLRTGLFQWQQDDKQNFNAIEIRHLSLDLKYHILNKFAIIPFTTYGASAIWGREEKNAALGNNFTYRGVGFNVGVGLDILPLKHWGIGVEYQYLYAKFDASLGLSDNYSGPKLTARIIYIF